MVGLLRCVGSSLEETAVGAYCKAMGDQEFKRSIDRHGCGPDRNVSFLLPAGWPRTSTNPPQTFHAEKKKRGNFLCYSYNYTEMECRRKELEAHCKFVNSIGQEVSSERIQLNLIAGKCHKHRAPPGCCIGNPSISGKADVTSLIRGDNTNSSCLPRTFVSFLAGNFGMQRKTHILLMLKKNNNNSTRCSVFTPCAGAGSYVTVPHIYADT